MLREVHFGICQAWGRLVCGTKEARLPPAPPPPSPMAGGANHDTATRRNMRREEQVTVQGPVKKQQPDGMSRRGLPKRLRCGVGGPQTRLLLLLAYLIYQFNSECFHYR